MKKEFSMPIRNNRYRECNGEGCSKSILSIWWIQVGARVYCRKCYDKTIRTSTKTSK